MGEIKVKHEGGRNVLKLMVDTARMVALSASQVMRRLDTGSIKLDEEDAPRGKAAPRPGPGMQGGGVNPYDSRAGARRSAAPMRRDAPRNAAPTRGSASPPRPASAPAKLSWWRRIFRRG